MSRTLGAALAFIGCLTLFIPMAMIGSADVTMPTCTTAQHDAYKLRAPDGIMYPAWHPQIDPINHCVFQHEHGSDPGLMLPSGLSPNKTGWADVYMGYVGAKAGMSEPHEGFKVFAFDDRNGHLWRIMIHQGSWATGRVCAQFHSMDVAIIDNRTWETLAFVHFMGDWGRAESNQHNPITPTACPNQAADAAGSSGVRQFRVFSEPNSVVYDPWRLDTSRLIIPLDMHAFTLFTNSINDCHDATCDTFDLNYNALGGVNDGIDRFFQIYPGTGIESTGPTGTFYTDPKGRELRQATDPDAIGQYIKPGASFALPEPAGKCNPWGIAMIYHCGYFGQGWQYENYSGAVQAPN